MYVISIIFSNDYSAIYVDGKLENEFNYPLGLEDVFRYLPIHRVEFYYAYGTPLEDYIIRRKNSQKLRDNYSDLSILLNDFGDDIRAFKDVYE